MQLYEKIIAIYPQLTNIDFFPNTGTIILQDDGAGEYIVKWEHPTLSRPTDTQLAEIE
jgi:hypothetical protein